MQHQQADILYATSAVQWGSQVVGRNGGKASYVSQGKEPLNRGDNPAEDGKVFDCNSQDTERQLLITVMSCQFLWSTATSTCLRTFFRPVPTFYTLVTTITTPTSASSSSTWQGRHVTPVSGLFLILPCLLSFEPVRLSPDPARHLLPGLLHDPHQLPCVSPISQLPRSMRPRTPAVAWLRALEFFSYFWWQPLEINLVRAQRWEDFWNTLKIL